MVCDAGTKIFRPLPVLLIAEPRTSVQYAIEFFVSTKTSRYGSPNDSQWSKWSVSVSANHQPCSPRALSNGARYFVSLDFTCTITGAARSYAAACASGEA